MMSRRRFLLIWTLCFTVFILGYIYLPFSVENSTSKGSIIPEVEFEPAQRTLPTHPNKNQSRICTSTESPETSSTTQTTTAMTTRKSFALKKCEPNKEFLVGGLYVNQTVPSMKEVIEELSIDYDGFVERGGAYKPKNCIAKNKLAIIIPYRNRSEHLRIFLRHMHPIMQRQMHDYRIIVVEQAGNYSFNRATLINIGFLEALKFGDFECFVFHDVDHILENDRNDYGCPEAPKLLGVSVDRFYRRFPYLHYFGGVGAFTKEQFEKINGYSNKFWGWGGEDDDAYNRIRAAGYNLQRSTANIGRYTMLKKNHVRAQAGPNRNLLLKTSAKRMYEDGLSDVQYTVKKKTEYPLYTLIVAQLKEELDVPPTIVWQLNPE